MTIVASAAPRTLVVGTGSYLPGKPITNDDIETLAGPLPPEILEDLSVRQRFWIADPETGEHRESNSSIALVAAERALEDAEMSADDLDLIILSTGTPDYPLPAVVNMVQEGLGINAVATLELRSAGAGVVQGMLIADSFIRDGMFRNALVIGSEAISPVIIPKYLGKDPGRVRMRDRMPIYMFGDGAGAIVMKAGNASASGGILGGEMRAIGGDRKAGIIAVGGGTHASIREQQEARELVDLRVDVVNAGALTPQMIIDAVGRTLVSSGLTADEIDYCLIPEGNVGWMTSSMSDQGLTEGDWNGMSGRIVDRLATRGAIGSAAIPLFLDELARSGDIGPGSVLMIIGIESTKWIHSGLALEWTKIRAVHS